MELITLMIAFTLMVVIAIILISKLETEDKNFELEGRIAKVNNYINVVVRSDFEVSTLDVLVTIQEILRGTKWKHLL